MAQDLTGESAADRVVLNNAGDRTKSTDVTPILRAGQTVGYLVNDPTAYYVRARPGMYTGAGRNILEMRPIDNFDISVGKSIPFREHYKVEFRVDMYNAFNHPQYT